jgi:hypothetical protein
LTLEQLKKILRAAREITEQDDFYVIGSAAILQVFNSPGHDYLSRSNEADLIATGYLNEDVLRERLIEVECTEAKRRQIESSIGRYFP